MFHIIIFLNFSHVQWSFVNAWQFSFTGDGILGINTDMLIILHFSDTISTCTDFEQQWIFRHRTIYFRKGLDEQQNLRICLLLIQYTCTIHIHSELFQSAIYPDCVIISPAIHSWIRHNYGQAPQTHMQIKIQHQKVKYLLQST